MGRHHISKTGRGALCAVLGGAFGGLSGICSQALFAHWTVDPLWAACIRLLGSGAVLTLLSRPRHRRDLLALVRRRGELLRLLCFGAGLMLCQSAYLKAISWTNAATATVLQNLSLVLVMVASCAMARRLPRGRETVSLMLAVLGAWLLATGGRPGQLVLVPQGLAWGLASAAAVALYMMLSQDLLARWDRQTVIGPGMLLGGAVLFLLSRPRSPSLPPAGWAALGGVVLGTVLSFSLVIQGIAEAGPVRASMLAASEPVTAAVLAVLLMGDRFSGADLAGFACIITTILLLARPEGSTRKDDARC